MDADEFIEWLGNQLNDCLKLHEDEVECFQAGHRLCAEAKRILDDMPQETFASTKSKYDQAYQNRIIGSFKIPYDDEDLGPLAEAITGTIDGFFEWRYS